MVNFFWKVARLSRDTELRVGDFGRSVKRRKVFFESLEEGSHVWRKLFWKGILKKGFPGVSRDGLSFHARDTLAQFSAVCFPVLLVCE